MSLTRRRFLVLLAGAGASGMAVGRFFLPGLEPAPHAPAVARRAARAFGARVSLTVRHADAAVAESALDDAFAALERVERVMSLYRPASGLCRLNREGVLVDPDPWLCAVIDRALHWAGATGGAFDPTVQPLWDVYAAASATGRLPDAATVEAARARVGWRDVSVSPDRIAFGRSGMAVTLNGIAQGFALDRAAEALRARGVAHALLDTGEIGAFGSRPTGDAWIAGVQHPRREDAFVALARMDGRCLATSGDYETFFTPDRASHHIVDPVTGRSPHGLQGVTVAAPTGIDADALSTAVFVLGVDRGLAWLRSVPGADALCVRADGSVVRTPGFPEVG